MATELLKKHSEQCSHLDSLAKLSAFHTAVQAGHLGGPTVVLPSRPEVKREGLATREKSNSASGQPSPLPASVGVVFLNKCSPPNSMPGYAPGIVVQQFASSLNNHQILCRI